MSEFTVELVRDEGVSMNNKRLDALWETVYRKMESEFDDFHNRLLTASPQEIFDSAYEINVKQGILTLMENHDLSETQLGVLTKQECPLDTLYQEWLRCDSGQIEELGYCVNEFVNNILRQGDINDSQELGQKMGGM